MAITGAIFNSLMFGGVNSADYGVYITGEAVYNAPQRAVQMVEVAGRNGQIAIDQGRWDNIEVSYHAGIFGDDTTGFRERLSDFRNAILSQIGYQRLTDTYHPDEYRMGLYVDGIEVAPINTNKAGEFTLTFNCKPQRWLTGGETPVTVESGDVLTNPTQYDAGPLLMVEGYGTIGFNGYLVRLKNELYGETEIVEPRTIDISDEAGTSYAFALNSNMYNEGDTITVNPFTAVFRVYDNGGVVNDMVDTLGSGPAVVTVGGGNRNVPVNVRFGDSIPITFTAGTFGNYTQNMKLVYKYSASNYASLNADIDIEYDPNENALTISSVFRNFTRESTGIYPTDTAFEGITVDSTESILGHPTYIDCEMGTAYKFVNGKLQTLNKNAIFGSDLPKLASGANEISILGNRITELKIKPNWWKL